MATPQTVFENLSLDLGVARAQALFTSCISHPVYLGCKTSKLCSRHVVKTGATGKFQEAWIPRTAELRVFVIFARHICIHAGVYRDKHIHY